MNIQLGSGKNSSLIKRVDALNSGTPEHTHCELSPTWTWVLDNGLRYGCKVWETGSCKDVVLWTGYCIQLVLIDVFANSKGEQHHLFVLESLWGFWKRSITSSVCCLLPVRDNNSNLRNEKNDILIIRETGYSGKSLLSTKLPSVCKKFVFKRLETTYQHQGRSMRFWRCTQGKKSWRAFTVGVWLHTSQKMF